MLLPNGHIYHPASTRDTDAIYYDDIVLLLDCMHGVHMQLFSNGELHMHATVHSVVTVLWSRSWHNLNDCSTGHLR